jgi:hypothetical protein
MAKKKARFIADSVRVRHSRFGGGLYIEAREARVADPVAAYVPLELVPALMAEIAKCAIACAALDGRKAAGQAEE